MKTQGTKRTFEGKTVYVGLDVHKATWKAATCTQHTSPGPWTLTIQKPFVENLRSHLDKHFPKATFLCGYETGFCGFWIHDALKAAGLPTIVLHAADIPTSDKERDQKDDRSDARKIARALKESSARGIYVPPKQAQIDRSVVRERYSVAKCNRRVKVQIKSHLALYGIEIPEDMSEQHWSGKFIKWLEQIRDTHGDKTLRLLLDRLFALRKVQLEANRTLRQLSREERYREIYAWILSVPGVGPLTSMLLVTEIVDICRFDSMRKLCSYMGFIPTKYSSSDKEVHGNMTNRRNKRLRTALIESSWTAIKCDPALLLKYEEYRKRMNSQRAIVRIARILLRRIRYVWLTGQPYQKGLV